MAHKPRRSPQPVPTNDRTQTLSKLHRLYRGSGRQPDMFGRRPALPSEIEKLVKREGK
ncbi:MAG: hypothetical protein H6649_03210 [Caldilineae bacterium]|nr:hypothetical protein [Anaerolineae bacterium]MCB9153050.1 hypothetical protein [Caldilineae bacterium]